MREVRVDDAPIDASTRRVPRLETGIYRTGSPRRLVPRALGSYEASPLDIAGAYTIFANHGVYACGPLTGSSAPNRRRRHKTESHQVLDPRVASLMVNLMEDVVNSGTEASPVARLPRSRGPETGTSRDGWFAGLASN